MTKRKFNAYRRVQHSGVTNMFAIDMVRSLSGLKKEECLDIMKNYEKYAEQYGEYKEVL